MNLSELRNKAWPLQESFLRNLLEKKAATACSDLHQAVKHQVFAGGKRLRACLPLAAAVKLKGETSSLHDFPAIESCPDWIQSALISGLSLELLHSGTLAHDDVMDGDTVRRNKPTVWVDYGIPQAINTGDELFYLAQELITESALAVEAKLMAHSWMARAMQQVIHGQSLEISLRRDQILPNLQTYNSVVVGKTGGLFGLGLVYGGLAAHQPVQSLEKLYAIGLQLGALFQVQDDLVDIVGEKQRGCPNNDLWEGKPSWLIAFCAQAMDSKAQGVLSTKLYKARAEKTEAEVSELRSMLDQYDAINAGLLELGRLQGSIRKASEHFSPESSELIDDLTKLFLRPLTHLL